MVSRQFSPLYTTYYCFLQPDLGTFVTDSEIHIVFTNNTADYAGSVLYGGYIDSCLVLNSIAYRNQSKYSYLANDFMLGYSTEVFNSLFVLQNNTGPSAISSDPIGVCVCEENQPRCERKVIHNATYPGSTVEITAVVVGQRNGVSLVWFRLHSPTTTLHISLTL